MFQHINDILFKGDGKCEYHGTGTFVIEIPAYKTLDIKTNRKVIISVQDRTTETIKVGNFCHATINIRGEDILVACNRL